MLQLSSLNLGERPCVAVAIRDGVEDAEIYDALKKGADLLELRIDQFAHTDEDYVLKEIRRYLGIPLLGTIRTTKEGGDWAQSEDARCTLYEQITPHVHAIDVEISTEICATVTAIAQERDCLSIGSFHDFEATPSLEQLREIAQEGRACGVDIVKVACTCTTPEDLRTLAQFTLEEAPKHVITIGMGPAGMLSRLFFPALGSLITYTFLGSATAPGQLNCEATLEYLGKLYPSRQSASQ